MRIRRDSTNCKVSRNLSITQLNVTEDLSRMTRLNGDYCSMLQIEGTEGD
jgi:hypothetical protein